MIFVLEEAENWLCQTAFASGKQEASVNTHGFEGRKLLTGFLHSFLEMSVHHMDGGTH
jgi:hypothetical protein